MRTWLEETNIQVSVDLVTCSRSKLFKEALNGMINEI